MERQQFTFFVSFDVALSRIRKKADRCDAYDAIVKYALYEIEPDLDAMADAAAMAFILAKPSLDSCRKKAQNGAKGGTAKQNASEDNEEANGKQWQTESKTEANPKRERERVRGGDRVRDRERMLKDTSEEKPAPKKANPKDEAFDRFWAVYPKKVGKGDARRAFDKVKVDVGILIAAVERQKGSAQWQRDDGQYIPNPATWLNQGRWEDELPSTVHGIQQHGAEMSPLMLEAVRRMTEEAG
jgi:hypothetical protein